MTAVPWTYRPRPDTRTTNVRVGIWLFLASEAMLFGSLFSAYVLLRTGAAEWTSAGAFVSVPQAVTLTALLAAASAATRRWLWVSAAGGALFVVVKAFDYAQLLEAGRHPATDLAVACWFVLTGLHWLHVAGGTAAAAWIALGARAVEAAHVGERLHALRLYWAFVDVIWLAILVSFFI